MFSFLVCYLTIMPKNIIIMNNNDYFFRRVHYFISPEINKIFNDLDLNVRNKGKEGLSSKISRLELELDMAVSSENFERAVELRDELKDLKNNYSEYEEKQRKNQQRLNDIERELSIAISEQDFEKAVELRDERKKILDEE